MGILRKVGKVVKALAPILAPPQALVAMALAREAIDSGKKESDMALDLDGLFDELDKATAKAEGGYVNDPKDPGGETNHGITVAVARENGYTGRMVDMTAAQAKAIRKGKYWIRSGVYRIAERSPAVAREVYDTGINMGTGTAAIFFQRALNALNREGTTYPDIEVDGGIGNKTIDAWTAFIAQPGAESVMLKALNGLQTARYIELSESRKANERFTNGWISQRVD